jgi:protein-tyrosine phosphatase
VSDVYWIKGDPPAQLAIVLCPLGPSELTGELLCIREERVETLVSLLEPKEAARLGLAEEGPQAIQLGMKFLSFPIRDGHIPHDSAAFRSFVADLAARLRAGERIGVHCRGSIGRATVTAVCALIHLGWEHHAALAAVEAARGCPVPDTQEQEDWILHYKAEEAATPASSSEPTVDLTFSHRWQAKFLPEQPLILPARHYVYPTQAEEVERGALEVLIRPGRSPARSPGGSKEQPAPSAENFLATCTLGFQDPAVPTGLWSAPNPDEICAVSGGYAYLIDTTAPERFTMIPFRPVLEVRPVPTLGLLLFVGHHAVLAWRRDGQAWQSEKLSDEGVTITSIESGILRGLGWKMLTDKETPFELDLRTGSHT